jgi:hypothetical protein
MKWTATKAHEEMVDWLTCIAHGLGDFTLLERRRGYVKARDTQARISIGFGVTSSEEAPFLWPYATAK